MSNKSNTMAAWLKTMRERHHMTQDDLIVALKQSYGKAFAKSTISGWELGSKNPPIEDKEFITALAQIFNVTGAEVLLGAGYSLGPAYEGLDEDQKLLLMAYESGDLERLVRAALQAKDKTRHHRLESSDGENDEERGRVSAGKSAHR